MCKLQPCSRAWPLKHAQRPLSPAADMPVASAWAVSRSGLLFFTTRRRDGASFLRSLVRCPAAVPGSQHRFPST